MALSARPGDGIAYAQPFARVVFPYYMSRAESSTGHQITEIARASNWGGKELGELVDSEASPGSIDRRLSPYARIWVVSYPASTGYLSPEPTFVGPTQLSPHFQLGQRMLFGAVVVFLYIRHA